jgi:hypothetical protein
MSSGRLDRRRSRGRTSTGSAQPDVDLLRSRRRCERPGNLRDRDRSRRGCECESRSARARGEAAGIVMVSLPRRSRSIRPGQAQHVLARFDGSERSEVVPGRERDRQKHLEGERVGEQDAPQPPRSVPRSPAHGSSLRRSTCRRNSQTNRSLCVAMSTCAARPWQIGLCKSRKDHARRRAGRARPRGAQPTSSRPRWRARHARAWLPTLRRCRQPWVVAGPQGRAAAGVARTSDDASTTQNVHHCKRFRWQLGGPVAAPAAAG